LGGHILDFIGSGPDYKPIATFKVDANTRLILLKDGQRFVFGSRAKTR
jgi:hypothetical protein